MYNLFKVGKNYKNSNLYLQDIQSLIKTDDTEINKAYKHYCEGEVNET